MDVLRSLSGQRTFGQVADQLTSALGQSPPDDLP
jgi:hypothetical protein